ncbi:MAG: GAP family protein [Mycobacteriaceae bacterium]|nr:GAP family protein [Mycobacteriaceae bacterium]
MPTYAAMAKETFRTQPPRHKAALHGSTPQSSVPAMWGTVLALAFVATADPLRIGIALFLFSRSRPALHLFALWLGGLALSLLAGLAVLFALRDPALSVMRGITQTTASTTAGQIQIAMGALAMLIAASIVIGFPMPRARATHADRDPSSRLLARAHQALQGGGSLWAAFFVGVGLTTDVRYLAALAAILASGAAIGTQISAATVYTVMTLAFVEIPLISLLAAPAKTHAAMQQLHAWIYRRRRSLIAIALTAVGIALMATGIYHL